MDWQQIVSLAIVVGALAVALRWLWRQVCGRRKGGCASCGDTDCALRNARRDKKNKSTDK